MSTEVPAVERTRSTSPRAAAPGVVSSAAVRPRSALASAATQPTPNSTRTGLENVTGLNMRPPLRIEPLLGLAHDARQMFGAQVRELALRLTRKPAADPQREHLAGTAERMLHERLH